MDVVGAPQVDHQPVIVGSARLLSAAQPRGAAAFAGRPHLSGQLLDAGTLIFRKALNGLASSFRSAPRDARSDHLPRWSSRSPPYPQIQILSFS
jgi:hypothetical protein